MSVQVEPRVRRPAAPTNDALARLGRTPEAQGQFKVAAALDLTPTERAELVRVQGAR
jgi:hypothetical protein